jgi:hypothetical protein
MRSGNSVATEVAVAIVFRSDYDQAEAVRPGIDKVPGASVLF